MPSNPHLLFRQKIDEALAAGYPPTQDRALQDHLNTCTPCQEYLAASTQAIAALSGFSFEASPALNANVFAALQLRAAQLDAVPLYRRHLKLVIAIALALTSAGSFLDLQFGRFLAAHFNIAVPHLEHSLLDFWLAPSLCLLLLFPLLPRLSALVSQRHERTSNAS